MENITEKKVEPSIFDLNFTGFLKFAKEMYCMILCSFVMACGAWVIIIMFMAICGIYIPMWGHVLGIIFTYIGSLCAMYKIQCKKCRKCTLMSLCNARLQEKQKKVHDKFVTQLTANILFHQTQIDRCRRYIDNLMKLEQTIIVKNEINRTLEKINTYEERCKQYEDVMKNN